MDFEFRRAVEVKAKLPQTTEQSVFGSFIEKDKNNVHFKGIYNGQSYEFKLYSTDGVRWDVNYFGLV